MKRKVLVWLVLAAVCCSSAALAADPVAVYWNGIPVTVKTPGSYQSVIRIGRSEETVLSSELTWENSTDFRFGYIWAPNLGKVNMRKGPRPKAGIILKAETNRVVLIFDRTQEWTGVIYDGKAGYVMNATVKMIEKPETPKDTATLSYKGRTTGTTKITMRMLNSQGSRAVVGLRPGMPVTLFKKGDTFSEVEVNGWHGFVLTEHLADIVPAEIAAAELATGTDLPPSYVIQISPDEVIEVVDLDAE